MDQANKLKNEVEARVAAWMRELFGTMTQPREGGGLHRVHFGSATVDVSVTPWGEREVVITAQAAVVHGATLQPDLMQYLLQKNGELRFGAFGLDATGDIVFRHSIVGSTCQKEELKASVQQVMLVADLSDDEIVKRWGGRRARDLAP
jgi:hypothetical protein